jgi:hypothetical protein
MESLNFNGYVYRDRLCFYLPRDFVCEFLSIYIYIYIYIYMGARGGVVVKALHYKPAGRGFDSRWCKWNLSVT